MPEKHETPAANETSQNGKANSFPTGSAPAVSIRVACHKCRAPNAPAHKFCGKCGTLLWEPCIECSERVSPGEVFCGNCGINLSDAVNRRMSDLRSGIHEAQQLKCDYRYQEAVERLARLTSETHPRLVKLSERARHLLDEVRSEQENQGHDAEAAFQAAQLYVSDKDFPRARRALESIPEAFRNEEMENLLEEVRQVDQEVAGLKREVRSALQKKETRGLLPKVERLVELDPDDEDARRLLTRLQQVGQKDDARQRDRHCRAAKNCLLEFDYDHAVEQLKLVPDSMRDDDVQKLYDHAVELQWLMDDLRTSPVVDSALRSVGERLVKLQPKNAKAVELLEEVKRREHGKPKDPRLAAVAWVRPPKRTYVGCQVEWIGQFARIPVTDKAQATLTEHPGRFFVATGLALQAMGRSRLQINLLPQEKQGLLGLLGPITQRRSLKPAGSGWGIDVGSTSLKAVRLVWDEDKKVARVAACTIIEHEKNLGRPDAEWSRHELVTATLSKFLEEQKPDLKHDRVCVGLPGGKSLGRFCKLPPVKKGKLQEAAKYEAQHQIPLPLDSLVWDYQLLQSDDQVDDEAGEMFDMVLLASQLTDVRAHLQPFHDLEFRIDCVQTDAVAIYNYVAHDYWGGPPEAVLDDDLLALVDLGSDATNVVIGSPDVLWFRSISRGADEFTKHLMREFNLTFDHAEKLKRQPTKARRVSRFHAAITRPFDDLVNDIQLSFKSYEMAGGEEERPAPRKIMAFGAGMQAHGLLRYMQMGK